MIVRQEVRAEKLPGGLVTLEFFPGPLSESKELSLIGTAWPKSPQKTTSSPPQPDGNNSFSDGIVDSSKSELAATSRLIKTRVAQSTGFAGRSRKTFFSRFLRGS